MAKNGVKKMKNKTNQCPVCKIHLIGIEIQGGYDGISYWDCPNCGRRWDRFTGKQVMKWIYDNDDDMFGE